MARVMSEALYQALEILVAMRHPSVETIVRGRGYDYEADAVFRVVTAFEKQHPRQAPEV